jgi:acetyl esterase
MPSLREFAADTQALLARGIALVPPSAQRFLSGRPPRIVDGQVLDPGIQLLLRLMALRGYPAFVSGPNASPAAERAHLRREAHNAVGRFATRVGSVSELIVDGAAGPLAARHYAPPAPDRAPLLVFFHGGGWVVGDIDTHDEPCRLLCLHAGVHVLSVDYRLAPEHPFPAAVDDALAATRWALAHAPGLGADPARVAVGGDSAGGNLAAVASQELRSELAVQVLIYPGIELDTLETRSGRLFGEGLFLDNTSRRWCMDRYLPPGADRSDPRASPSRAKQLTGLPPAVVLTAAFDPLRDEGEAYAEALREAGNRVAVHRAEGLIHGFINFTTISRRARAETLALAALVRSELAVP